MQAISDGFYGAWLPNGPGIDVSALRVPTLVASLWCARDRLQALGKPVPPEVNKALAQAASWWTPDEGWSVDTVDARPLVAMVEEHLPTLLLAPCPGGGGGGGGGTHTPLCAALPRSLPGGQPASCAHFRLVHQGLFDLLWHGCAVGPEEEDAPPPGNIIELDLKTGTYEWAAFTGAKCCEAKKGCCEARPAPRLNRCRYHQILVNARKRKSDRRRRQKGAAPPPSPPPTSIGGGLDWTGATGVDGLAAALWAEWAASKESGLAPPRRGGGHRPHKWLRTWFQQELPCQGPPLPEGAEQLTRVYWERAALLVAVEQGGVPGWVDGLHAVCVNQAGKQPREPCSTGVNGRVVDDDDDDDDDEWAASSDATGPVVDPHTMPYAQWGSTLMERWLRRYQRWDTLDADPVLERVTSVRKRDWHYLCVWAPPSTSEGPPALSNRPTCETWHSGTRLRSNPRYAAAVDAYRADLGKRALVSREAFLKRMAAAGHTDVIDMLRKEVGICFYDLGIARLADGPKPTSCWPLAARVEETERYARVQCLIREWKRIERRAHLPDVEGDDNGSEDGHDAVCSYGRMFAKPCPASLRAASE